MNVVVVTVAMPVDCCCEPAVINAQLITLCCRWLLSTSDPWHDVESNHVELVVDNEYVSQLCTACCEGSRSFNRLVNDQLLSAIGSAL